MTNQKHVHKLKKVRFKSGNVTFFCALPDCTFKINPALALGKTCECWRCGKTFILGEYALRLVKPHCDECHHSKKDGLVLDTERKEVFDKEVTPDGTEIPILSLAERMQQEIRKAAESKEIEEDI